VAEARSDTKAMEMRNMEEIERNRRSRDFVMTVDRDCSGWSRAGGRREMRERKREEEMMMVVVVERFGWFVY
jgi:hypothetical protein